MSKKIIIVWGIVFGIFIIGTLYFFVRNRQSVTITFNTDGGNIIQSISIKKGSKTELPVPVKDNNKFLGWYSGDILYTNDTVFEKSIDLIAKWKEQFLITFNTNGGDSIASISYSCNEKINNLPIPTKTGYSFKEWQDENGKTISNNELILCDDITLNAIWDTNSNDNENNIKKTEYKCPDGYNLNGTKCILTKNASSNCPTDTYEYNGKCLKYMDKEKCPSDYTLDGNKCYKCLNEKCSVTTSKNIFIIETPTTSCGEKSIVVDDKGTKKTIQGEVLLRNVPGNLNRTCVYGEVNESEDVCKAKGHKWIDGKCYYDYDDNFVYTCTGQYIYLTLSQTKLVNKNLYNATNNLLYRDSGVCVPYTSKSLYCESGFTLKNGKCYKEIDALLN